MERNTAKRMLEKLLSVCICLCMLGAMLPAQVFAEEADTAQTETVQDTAPKDTVYLSSADDLIQLAKNCRLDSWSQNRTVVLDTDLEVSGQVEYLPESEVYILSVWTMPPAPEGSVYQVWLQVDDIIEQTGLPTRRVLSALTMMELEGCVEQGGGKHFSLNVILEE